MNEITKLGLFVSDPAVGQRNFHFITQINGLLANNINVDACAFYNTVAPPCVKPNFALVPAADIWGFHDGLIITTDIDTTLMAIKTCNSSKIIFYIDDLEWTRPNKQDFLYNIPAYRSNLVELVTPSVQYAKLVENYSNRKVSVVIPNYDLLQILKRFTNVNIR